MMLKHKCWPVYSVHRGNVCGSCDKQMEDTEPGSATEPQTLCSNCGQPWANRKWTPTVWPDVSVVGSPSIASTSTPPARSEVDVEETLLRAEHLSAEGDVLAANRLLAAALRSLSVQPEVETVVRGLIADHNEHVNASPECPVVVNAMRLLDSQRSKS